MIETRSANDAAGSLHQAVEDDEQLALIQRLAVEIKDSILRSYALVRSTRDALELVGRLRPRQHSN
jgi:hypothetical protein